MQKIDKEFESFMVGFFAGEAYFSVHITNSRNKLDIQNRFGLKCSMEEKEFITKIIQYFGCGNLTPSRSNKKTKFNKKIKTQLRYQVGNINELYNIIIPFFDRNNFFNCAKYKTYLKWKNLIEIIYYGKYKYDLEMLNLLKKQAFELNINGKSNGNQYSLARHLTKRP
jgi:hypothetical protein